MGEDEADVEALGHVGSLSGAASDYAAIWRIVNEARVPLSDIEAEWTWERICAFTAYRRMCGDYASAWRKFYERRRDDG